MDFSFTRDPFIFTRPWKLDFVFALPSYDLSTYLPDIRLLVCLLSNVKSPIVSKTFRIIEIDCSTCPGGESISAGTANFLEFSKGESISIFSNLDYRWWCQNVASYFSECEFIVWTCKHCEERSFFMEEVFLGDEENRFYTVIFYIGG